MALYHQKGMENTATVLMDYMLTANIENILSFYIFEKILH